MAGRFELPTVVGISFRRRHYMRYLEGKILQSPEPWAPVELAALAKTVGACSIYATMRENGGSRPFREHAESLLDTVISASVLLERYYPLFDEQNAEVEATLNGLRRELGALIDRCMHVLDDASPTRSEQVASSALRMLHLVVLVLPAPDRNGYAEEFEAELQAIAVMSHGRRRAQWAYTIRTAMCAVALRKSLLASRRQRVHGRG